MATQWPLVAARLVELLPTLPGWSQVQVFDGPPPTQTMPATFAIVGHVLAEGEAAGQYGTAQAPDGHRRIETGEVVCQLASQIGSAGVAFARAQAFSLMDALDEYIRSDRRMGVLSAEGTSRLAVNVMTAWNQSGTAQSLNFSVAYTTVT